MPRRVHPLGAVVKTTSFEASQDLLERLDADAQRLAREEGRYFSRGDVVRHYCEQGSKGAFVDATVASVKKE